MTELLQVPEAADATATLFDQYHSRIHAYCVGQLRNRDDADDAVQSTFLYAFALLQRGVVPRAELPWLYTIAHNVCRTRRRSLKRRSTVEAGIDLETLHDTVGRNDPPREELDGLGASLAELPEAQRRALLLREWQGLSYAEVAVRMGLTESAVEAVLFRARRNLAQKLRGAQRVASFASGVFFLRSLRRLSPYAGGKATAAAVAVGLAAATAVPPLMHTRTPDRHAAGRAPIAFVQHAAPARAAVTGRQSRNVSAHASVAAPALPTRHDAAVPEAPAAASPVEPTLSAPPPLAPVEPQSPTTSTPTTTTPVAGDPPPAPVSDSQPASAPPVRDPIVTLPSPPIPVPPPVQTVIDDVQAAIPPLPTIPNIVPPVTPPTLPPLPSLPSLSPKGTPLQDGP